MLTVSTTICSDGASMATLSLRSDTLPLSSDTRSLTCARPSAILLP